MNRLKIWWKVECYGDRLAHEHMKKYPIRSSAVLVLLIVAMIMVILIEFDYVDGRVGGKFMLPICFVNLILMFHLGNKLVKETDYVKKVREYRSKMEVKE